MWFPVCKGADSVHFVHVTRRRGLYVGTTQTLTRRMCITLLLHTCLSLSLSLSHTHTHTHIIFIGFLLLAYKSICDFILPTLVSNVVRYLVQDVSETEVNTDEQRKNKWHTWYEFTLLRWLIKYVWYSAWLLPCCRKVVWTAVKDVLSASVCYEANIIWLPSHCPLISAPYTYQRNSN
jgi:hypothetical protein